MEPLAFPAAKSPQWSDLFVAHEGLEFIATQQSAGDSFPNCEVTLIICAGKTFESLDDRRAALRALTKRLGVRHVLVGMKMLGFSDDIFSQFADVVHEGVARKLAVLD